MKVSGRTEDQMAMLVGVRSQNEHQPHAKARIIKLDPAQPAIAG